MTIWVPAVHCGGSGLRCSSVLRHSLLCRKILISLMRTRSAAKKTMISMQITTEHTISTTKKLTWLSYQAMIELAYNVKFAFRVFITIRASLGSGNTSMAGDSSSRARRGDFVCWHHRTMLKLNIIKVFTIRRTMREITAPQPVLGTQQAQRLIPAFLRTIRSKQNPYICRGVVANHRCTARSLWTRNTDRNL